MHDNVLLGGPVWAFAQFLIVLAIGLTLFVLVDSARPKRRAAVTAFLREPLWGYTVFAGLYLGFLLVIQVIPGLQLAAAVVSLATPFALALGLVYLLRVVFPKPGAAAGSAGEASGDAATDATDYSAGEATGHTDGDESRETAGETGAHRDGDR